MNRSNIRTNIGEINLLNLNFKKSGPLQVLKNLIAKVANSSFDKKISKKINEAIANTPTILKTIKVSKNTSFDDIRNTFNETKNKTIASLFKKIKTKNQLNRTLAIINDASRTSNKQKKEALHIIRNNIESEFKHLQKLSV